MLVQMRANIALAGENMPEARDYFILAYAVVLLTIVMFSVSLVVLWRCGRRGEFILGSIAAILSVVVLGYWLLFYKSVLVGRLDGSVITVWVVVGALSSWLLVRAVAEMLAIRHQKPFHVERRRLLSNSVAAIAGVAVGRTIAMYDPADVVIEQHICVVPHLPQSAEGLRIALIGDIHAGPYLEPKHLEYYIECIRRQKPDLCVIVGDFITADAAEFRDYCTAMRRLYAPRGVYAVLGNHDYFNGAAPTLRAMLSSCGVIVLDDRAVPVTDDGLELVGISDERRNAPVQALNARVQFPLMEKLGQSLCPIVLVHRPPVFDALATINPRSLVLAGHTHGGQLAIEHGAGNYLTITQLFSPYIRGWYRRGDAQLYVTRGVGTIGIPLRLGSPPEIAIITLRSHAT